MPTPLATGTPWLLRVPRRPAAGVTTGEPAPLTPAAAPAVTSPVMLPGNLITPADSDFEQPLTGNWQAFLNCSVALSTVRSFSGAASLAVTATTTGTVQIVLTAGSFGYLPAISATGVDMSLYAWNANTGRALNPSLSVFTIGGTNLGLVGPSALTLTAGAWTPVTGAVAIPAGGAATMQMFVQITGMQAGETTWIDLVYVARPLCQILTAWNTEPGNTPLFADMTMWTRADTPVAWSRGRQDNLSEVQAGQLSLTWANDLGWLSPSNTASPYYPNIKIGRRIQVNVPDETGTWHTRFDGQINSLELSPATTGLTADTLVQAADVIALLNRQSGLDSWTKREILLDNPVLHWTLDDPAGSSVAAESSGNNGPPLQIHEYGSGGTYAFAGGTGTLTTGQQNGMESQTWSGVGTPAAFPAVYFAQSHAGGTRAQQANWQLQATLPNPIVTTAGVVTTIEAFLIPDVPNSSVYPGGFTFWSFNLGNTRTGASIGVVCAGTTLQAQGLTNFGTAPGGASTTAAFSGSTPGPIQVAIVITGGASPTAQFYVAGVAIGTTFSVSPGSVFNYLTVGGPMGGFQGWLGQVSCVSIYNYALSTARQAVHALTASQGKYGNLAGSIINNVAQYASIPSFWNNLPFESTSGLSGIDYFSLAGENALSAMQAVEQADGGILYASAAGSLNYAGREQRMGARGPVLTLNAGTNGQCEADLGYKVNDQYLANEAAYSSAGIAAGAGIINTGSLADYGQYAQGTPASPTSLPLLTFNGWFQNYLNATGATVNAFSPDNLNFAAQWTANSHAQPSSKGASVRIDMLTLPATGPDGIPASTLLALEVGSVIALSGLPPQFPNVAHANEYFVEGVSETIQGGESAIRDLVLYTSPAQQGRAWIAGDPQYGKLDSTAVIGRSAVPSGNTIPAFESSGATFPGPPYYPPSYGTGMNTTGFVGDLDQAGIWANLQQQLRPPMVAVQRIVTNQAIPSQTTPSTTIAWDVTDLDTVAGMGWLAGFGNWYFILVPGWWQLHANVVYAANATGKRTAWFAVAQRAARNGTGPVVANANIIGSVSIVPVTGSATGIQLAAKVYCTLGTAISVQTWQNSGGSLNTNAPHGGSTFTARFLGDTATED